MDAIQRSSMRCVRSTCDETECFRTLRSRGDPHEDFLRLKYLCIEGNFGMGKSLRVAETSTYGDMIHYITRRSPPPEAPSVNRGTKCRFRRSGPSKISQEYEIRKISSFSDDLMPILGTLYFGPLQFKLVP